MRLNPVYVGDIPIVTDKQMRPRDEDDFYETDPRCLYAYFKEYDNLNDTWVLDPGAGTGAYGRVLRDLYPRIKLHGIEKNQQRFPDIPVGYDIWEYDDYLESNSTQARYVLGNPPYKLAEEFFWQSVTSLEDRTGTIDFLLRLGFLESETRYKSMWANLHRPTRVTVLNTRPSFTGDGKTYPAAFAFFRWDFIHGVCDERRELNFLTFKRDSHANR